MLWDGLSSLYLNITARKSVLIGYKGLGHAILGNLSTDRMVIELTKISK